MMASTQPILMPKLGLTMTEGLLAEWKVAPGDRVEVGDIIFIVETDKISNEVEASEAGIIEALLAEAGEIVTVGKPIATLAAEASAPRTIVAEHRVIATPLARRMAGEAGVDIGSLTGSGPRGRIMANDVSAAANAPPPTAAGRGQVRPLGKYQKVAARRLTEAKREIPHFYIFAEVDVTELLRLREQLNTDAGFTKLTINHFIIAALARALDALPAVNCVWTEDGILELKQIDVGLAVDSPKGLVAPVLHDLGGLSLDQIADAATLLVERARAGRLGQEAMEGGAISISNVGMFGAIGLLPIVNPGQSSILGVGRSQQVFRPDAHGRPALREVMQLSLSCDHRVIDGALAARFLQAVQDCLEGPWAFLRQPRQGTVA